VGLQAAKFGLMLFCKIHDCVGKNV